MEDPGTNSVAATPDESSHGEEDVGTTTDPPTSQAEGGVKVKEDKPATGDADTGGCPQPTARRRDSGPTPDSSASSEWTTFSGSIREATTTCTKGDAVEAVFAGNGSLYGATIAGVNADGTVTVNWADGDAAHRKVPIQQLFKNGIRCSKAYVYAPFCARGDAVEAVYAGNGTVYEAVVASVNTDGTVSVNWKDGDRSHRHVPIQQVFKNGVPCSKASPPSSHLNLLLEEDADALIDSDGATHENRVSIVDILDEDDITQEFEIGNPLVLDRLCTPEAVRVLLHLVTQGCIGGGQSLAEDLDCQPMDRISRRRPCIAGGILNSQSSSTERLLGVFEQPEGSDLLDLLWSFFDQPPSQIAPVLAGYTCSTAATLLAKRPAQVTEHLRQRDVNRLLDRFLCLMESKSCAELLACLLYAEDASKVVFPAEGLPRRLVACFDLEAGFDSSELEHMVWLVNVIVARSCMGVLCVGRQILREFSAPELVTTLIDQALSNSVSSTVAKASPAGSAAAASVLGILVYHTHLLQQDPLLPVKHPEMRPAGSQNALGRQAKQAPPPPPPREPPPALPVSSEASEICAEGSDLQATEQETPKEPNAQEPPDCSEASAEGSENRREDAGSDDGDEVHSAIRAMGTCGAALVKQIMARFPDLCGVLNDALERPDGSPAGATVLEVLCLFSHLAKTGREIVFQAACSADLLSTCLQLLFHFPWSTLLHNAVRSLVNEFLGNNEQGLPTVLALIRRSDIMERVAAEVGDESYARNGGSRDLRLRVGYIGHLRLLCEDLNELGRSHSEVGDILSRTNGWTNIVLPELEGLQRLMNTSGTPQAASAEGSPSGFGQVSEFDCISAVRSAMANLTDELELNLEDLRDLDEEMNASAVEMASARHAQRREETSSGTSTQPIENLDPEKLPMAKLTVQEGHEQAAEAQVAQSASDAEGGGGLRDDAQGKPFDEGISVPIIDVQPLHLPVDDSRLANTSSESEPPLDVGSINCTVGAYASTSDADEASALAGTGSDSDARGGN